MKSASVKIFYTAVFAFAAGFVIFGTMINSANGRTELLYPYKGNISPKGEDCPLYDGHIRKYNERNEENINSEKIIIDTKAPRIMI